MELMEKACPVNATMIREGMLGTTLKERENETLTNKSSRGSRRKKKKNLNVNEGEGRKG